MARGILVSPPGMEPVPLALEAWSRNPWTAKEVPVAYFSWRNWDTEILSAFPKVKFP